MTSRIVNINSSIEIVWAECETHSNKVLIGCCYRPPDTNLYFLVELRSNIAKALELCPADIVYLFGDFNFPLIDWKNLSSACRTSMEFISLALDFNLFQMITQPTRGTNILDLVFTNAPETVSEIVCLDGFSDHKLLQLTLNIPLQFTGVSNKTIRDYNRGDYNKINKELDTFLSGTFLTFFSVRSVQENWLLFKETLCKLVEKYIPLIKVSGDTRNPWFTKCLRRLRNKKKRLYTNAKRTNSPTAWDRYGLFWKEYCSALAEAKDKYYSHDLPSLLKHNPQKFWQVISPNSGSHHISLCDSNHVPVSDKDCAVAFNTFFSSVFTTEDHSNIPQVTDLDYQYMEPIDVTEDGIAGLINNLKLSSSSGPDNINSKILKNTVTLSSKFLYHIYRQSLSSGQLPSDWKTAKVVPVHKSGNKNSPENYRPISLTSICCKMLEHIIASHVYRHLESNNFFFSNQHGFRKGFSCETQLLEFTTDIHFNMDHSLQTDCIFLDFSKAFDRVAHCRLISKLSVLKLDSPTLSWIRNFLTNRQQFTIVNEYTSSLTYVTSGVPQGSVLGPLLFLIYINDLPNNISSCMRVFADDCILYRPIKSPDDHLILQHDLQIVSNWCEAWQMKLNSSKCKIMTFSRKTSNHSFSYHINTILVSQASAYKYLGVNLTSNLSWTSHITSICANASKSLGYIRRNLRNCPSDIRKLAFLTFVRPQLEFASPIWSPYHEYLIRMLEAIQNRASRFISRDYNYQSSITRIKLNLSLETLSSRRDIALLSLFHRYVYQMKPSNLPLVRAPCTSRRLHNDFSYNRIYGNTDAFNASALPRAIRFWNSLPNNTVAQTNKDKFRELLVLHFSS